MVRKPRGFLSEKFMSSKLTKNTIDVTVNYYDFEETYPFFRGENNVLTTFFKEEI